MKRDRLEIEFGVYTDWVLEAIESLGLSEKVPAACRGTADPDFLDSIADAAGIRAGSRVLDVGCGLGGPSAWFARRDCEVIAIDVMPNAATGAASLFPEVHFVVGSLRLLPFASASFDSVTALGVMEIVADKSGALTEIGRTLRPKGRAAIFSYFECGDTSTRPSADLFTSPEVIFELADRVGLRLLSQSPIDYRRVESSSWGATSRAVRNEIQSRHQGEPAFADFTSEIAKFVALRAAGAIAPSLLVFEKAAP
jgi:ubiquinone/menaquinone biosynthesis C-methylase UbiE